MTSHFYQVQSIGERHQKLKASRNLFLHDKISLYVCLSVWDMCTTMMYRRCQIIIDRIWKMHLVLKDIPLMRPEVAAALILHLSVPSRYVSTNSVSVPINSLLKNDRFVPNQDGQIRNQIQIITAPVLISNILCNETHSTLISGTLCH